MIFFYAGFFRADDSYPVPSQYRIITGKKAKSSGLSRAFSEMIRLNFQKAKYYHENSWEVFTFFFVQLFLRVLFFVSYNRTRKKKILIRFDATGSAILFLMCFKGIILSIYS